MTKKGDLVKFESGVLHWETDYALKNPGVVIDTTKVSRAGYKDGVSAKVLWSDTSVTSEWSGYLKKLEND